MEFVIVNGDILSKEEANLTAFVWNDPIVFAQKVWFGYGGIPLFDENLNSIKEQLATFNLQLPSLFRNRRELFRLSKRMLNKNRFYRSGYINYQFFISGKFVNTLITSHALKDFDFPYSNKGMLVSFSSIKKNVSLALGQFGCYNQSLWKSVKMHFAHSEFDGAILINENGFVCEGLASNIFMIKDGVLITPSLETGCYCDVLRSVLIEQATQLNMQILEIPKIEQNHLLEMDELFFASEENGIQWILGIENKRFVHDYSEKLYEKLNVALEHKAAQ